jgi:hypothetical protein
MGREFVFCSSKHSPFTRILPQRGRHTIDKDKVGAYKAQKFDKGKSTQTLVTEGTFRDYYGI